MSWQYCFCDIHAIKEIWMELNWREGEREKERERQRQRQRDRWGGQGGERMTRKLCFSVQHNGRYCCTLQPALFQQAYEGGTHGNICQDDFSKKKKKEPSRIWSYRFLQRSIHFKQQKALILTEDAERLRSLGSWMLFHIQKNIIFSCSISCIFRFTPQNLVFLILRKN